jgi:hypothetical protein
MPQVIIYANENGGVSTTYPTGEISIETVLAKDCPKGAIIVDESVLPTDNDFYDAWELVDGKVVVNETKKQTIMNAKQSPIDAKNSAISKLTELGLTQYELKALAQ